MFTTPQGFASHQFILLLLDSSFIVTLQVSKKLLGSNILNLVIVYVTFSLSNPGHATCKSSCCYCKVIL